MEPAYDIVVSQILWAHEMHAQRSRLIAYDGDISVKVAGASESRHVRCDHITHSRFRLWRYVESENRIVPIAFC